MEKYELHKKYRSRINWLASNCRYEIIKKNKTTCWVRLWEDNLATDKIYKNVKYSVLTES